MRLRAAAAALLIPLLSGCAGTIVSETFTTVGDEHGAGHTSATAHPSVPPGAGGSIELVSEFFGGGDGISVGEALDVASSAPVLVDGIVLRDADGTIWYCDRLLDDSPPRCSDPQLLVLNFPTDPDLFDPAMAETVGATTRDGITWLGGHQLYGVVHPAP
jgi:hypothetical protein